MFRDCGKADAACDHHPHQRTQHPRHRAQKGIGAGHSENGLFSHFVLRSIANQTSNKWVIYPFMEAVMVRIVCALTALTLLGACSQVHTTSGAEYLARYEATSKGAVIDREIREAASVEPILTFPARLGIAKINQGRMVGIRPTELKLWSEIAARNHRLGEFVAVSPLIAEFADDSGRLNRTALFGDARELVKKIRIGAARQHVDAVLVYGVDSAAHRDSTLLAFSTSRSLAAQFCQHERSRRAPSRARCSSTSGTAMSMEQRPPRPRTKD